MNLLFSISYFSPYSSGLSLYAKRLAEALVRKNYHCTVITNRHSGELPEEEKLNGVMVVRAKPVIKISKGFLSFDFISKSYYLVRQSKIVFVNLPQFEGIIPAIWGKLFGKKIIAIYHCEVNLPKGIINLFIEECLNLANFMVLGLSEKIITYTDDFAKHARLLPNFKDKLQTVYPPIIGPEINKRVQKDIFNKISKNAEIVIGVAARLAAEKGVEYLLEALPQIISKLKSQNSNKQIEIVVAGSLNPVGEQNYREKIFRLAEKYKENIIFLGELKESEMGSFYSLLDVLVLPSVNSTEGFGMVQVEAMMMGVPVVATNLPGVRVPVAKTGMGKIVPIRDSEAIASAILEIIMNKKKYVKNKRIIEDEFSINKTVNFYENLINKK